MAKEVSNSTEGSVSDKSNIASSLEKSFIERTPSIFNPAVPTSVTTAMISVISICGAGIVLYFYLKQITFWTGEPDLSSRELLWLSVPYIIPLVALLCFSLSVLIFSVYLARADVARWVVLQHADTSDALQLVAPLIRRGLDEPAWSETFQAFGSDLEAQAAGEWVMARFSEGKSVVAIPTKLMDEGRLAKDYGSGTPIDILYPSSPERAETKS